MWKCVCNCPDKTECVVSSTHLVSGHTQSCGCYMREQTSKANSKHKLCESRLYNIWRDMKARCFNEKNPDYSNYGGRGIRISPKWLDKKTGFINFYKWSINNGYQDKLSIDRINVNGNYEPDNCQWITVSENSRKDKLLFRSVEDCENLFNLRAGLGVTQKELANRLGVSRATIKRAEKRMKEAKYE